MGAKSLAEEAFRRSGALALLRFSSRNRLRILMYHRFPGSEAEIRAALERQCDHLRRAYHPVSASEVADALHGRRPLPPNSLTITVDDGYRDFQAAWNIFRSFGLQVTLFVVSRFVDRELWLWPDQVKILFETTPLDSVEIPLPDGTAFHWPAGATRQAAAHAFGQKLIRVRNADRLRLLAELPGLLRTRLPSTMPERFAPLGWDDLREMADQGLEVGAHTRSHPLLSRVETEEEVEREIAGSREHIQSRLQRPVIHFCYPNGKCTDYDERAVAAVKRAGCRTAFNAEPGLNALTSDPFQLSRIGVDLDYSPAYFERCVAGYRIPREGAVIRPHAPATASKTEDARVGV